MVTSFKAHTLELHSVQGKNIKNSINISTLFRFGNNDRLRIVQISFKGSFVIHLAEVLAGHLRTAILAHTIYVAFLRITLGTQWIQV